MFRLLPYYSAASAIVVLVMITSLTFGYRQVAVNEMVRSTEAHNVAFARIFANHLWPRLAPFIEDIRGASKAQLTSHPTILDLEHAVAELAEGLPILKIKIYDLDGLTVFSSNADQIGNDKSENLGFLMAARNGKPSTKLTHRETFSAIAGELRDRDVVESYVPVQVSGNAPEAVFELYADVTDLSERIYDTTLYIISITLIAFAVLYGVLYLIVRHADRILKEQYQRLQDNEKELSSTLDELKKAEEEIRHAANHDALTGLPSLRLCQDRLASALSLARRQNSIMAIFFIDLDGFKGVNDTQGHEAGDHVLKEISQRLSACVREMDTAARIGGDEFMIIYPKIADDSVIEALGNKIITSVREPIPWKDELLSVGASVGISLYPDHGNDSKALIREADDAMYMAKRKGKNQYAIAKPRHQDEEPTEPIVASSA